MDPAEHEKRIDWLFSRIKEAVLSADFSDEPGPWNRAQPGQLGRIVRDLCDDALADAYGSGEMTACHVDASVVLCMARTGNT